LILHIHRKNKYESFLVEDALLFGAKL